MHVSNKVDHVKVRESYKTIKSLYQSFGVEVYEIQAVKGLPDMVYSANFGQVVEKSFIKANFKYPQRRAEADFAAKYFVETFGFKTLSLPSDIFFEGQGDLLNDGKRYFFGWGKRSQKEAKPYLEKFLEAEVIDFELINPYYYHLDTCFAPLRPDLVMINPKSFKPEGIKKVYESFANVIETNDEDNKFLACNLIRAGKNIVFAKGQSKPLREKLEGLGYVLHEVEMDEYIKGGGSVKCVSFEF
jgi:N-dimethylarginine dimethylaminohydrolase